MFQAWQQDTRQCHFQQAPVWSAGQGRDAPVPRWWPQASSHWPIPSRQVPGVGWALLGGSGTALPLRQGCAGVTRIAPAKPAEPGEQVVMQTPGVAVRAPMPQFPPGCTPLLQQKVVNTLFPASTPPPRLLQSPTAPCSRAAATRATMGFPRAGAAPRMDVLSMGELSCSTCCQLNTPAHPAPASGRALGHDSSAAKLGLGRAQRRSPAGPGWGDQGRGVLPS